MAIKRVEHYGYVPSTGSSYGYAPSMPYFPGRNSYGSNSETVTRYRSVAESAEVTIVKDLQATTALHSDVDTIHELSNHIVYGTSVEAFDSTLFMVLEKKMNALDEQFPAACREVGLKARSLIWAQEK